MSRGGDADFAGISWGSNHFRAYRIAPDGALVDEFSRPEGVMGSDRAGMTHAMAALVERWPALSAVWASGMIGSNLGWTEVPYAAAPAGRDDLARAATLATIGPAAVHIVPGIACLRAVDQAPDVLRGEEVELLGLMAGHADTIAVLPGAHPKWISLNGGRVGDFFTALSGEMFDRLTAQGLLASIVEGEAEAGDAFHDGLAVGQDGRLTLGTMLFGARARVMRGLLARRDAASYLRGIFIGAEMADARRLLSLSGTRPVAVFGSDTLAKLYVAALAAAGVHAELVDPRAARVAGFHALRHAV